MSQTKMLEVVAPAYLEKFSCLGSACPDDCCHGWAVNVDHDTYSRLKGLPDKELKPVIMHALQRGKGKSGSGDYGYLSRKRDGSGSCEFLSEERLCRLQQKCGDQILPDVCASFPRQTKMIGGKAEQFASPACPEVARLLIANGARAVQLTSGHSRVRTDSIAKSTQEMEGRAIQLVREFFLRLLATQELATWKSFAIMLILADVLVPLFEKDEVDEQQVAKMLEAWEVQLSTGGGLDEFQALRRQDILHVKVLAATSRVRSDMDFQHPRYLQLIEEALQGLALNSGGVGDEQVAYGFSTVSGILEIDSLLRPILFNHAASKYFPRHHHLMEDVQILCMIYLSLRFWLVGLHRARNGLSEAEAVELVYLFYRANIHMPAYLGLCRMAFLLAGMKKVEHWLLLLPLHGNGDYK